MSHSTDLSEQARALNSIHPPSSSMERFPAHSSSVYTMSSSLEPERLAVLYNESTSETVFFTTDGTDPSDPNTYGTADIGVPVAPAEKFPLYFSSEATGSMTLKLRATADDTDVTVYQYQKGD